MASGIFKSPQSPPQLPQRSSGMSWLPTLSVMDRYIILELLPPFLFGVGAFTSLGISIGALFDLIRKVSEYGLPFGIATQVLLLTLPQFISYSFPMSVLLAVLITYSRFSSDSELVALKGCGIKVSRVIVPAIALLLGRHPRATTQSTHVESTRKHDGPRSSASRRVAQTQW